MQGNLRAEPDEARAYEPQLQELELEPEHVEYEERRPSPRRPVAPSRTRQPEPEPQPAGHDRDLTFDGDFDRAFEQRVDRRPERHVERRSDRRPGPELEPRMERDRDLGRGGRDRHDRRFEDVGNSTPIPIASRLRTPVAHQAPPPDTESMMTIHAERVDIDPHGRVVPQDDTARRILAERTGSYAVLPTSPDLLVARRTPVAGGTGPRARCSLAGDLALFPIADLIAFTHQSRLSGMLTVSTPGAERVLAFRDGEVRGARSTAPGERIGELAARMGYVNERQLAAVATARSSIGKALVDRGFISRNDLWKCLHEQAKTVFHGVLIAREGVFAMVDDPDLDLGATLSLSTQALLMDGIRRIDEMAVFRTRVPGMHVYLRRRRPSVPVALEREEEALLRLVDGRRCVEDVANLLHLDEFETTKIVYRLAEAGYLEVVGEPVAEQASPERAPERSTEYMSIASGLNAILRLIVRDVASVSSLESFLEGVRGFLSDIESKYAPLWHDLAPARDGSIDVARLLANLGSVQLLPDTFQTSGGAAAYLFEGIRELTLFYLFQAGEVVHWSTHERLHLEVKRWFEALGDRRRMAQHEQARAG